MSFLDSLERKFGRFCVPHLLAFLLLGQVALFLMQGAGVVDAGDLVLYGALAVQGEWHRVFTFLIMPLDDGLLFFLIGVYITWFIGSTLEAQWGEFRFNLYILTGWVLSILGSLAFPTIPFHNFYIYMSLTLAFAVLFPNFEFLLFFILPVKVKWLAVVMWLGIALSMGVPENRPVLVTSLASFFLFFGPTIVGGLKAGARSRKFRREQASVEQAAFHTCSICGRNDKSDPQREFRYKGGACYCRQFLEQGSCDAS